MPRAFGYARISHPDQENEDSLPGQIARVEAYWNLMLRERGIDWGGAEYDEFAVSATKKPFQRRPAGIRLLNKIQKGDHIIFDKVDRVWRSVEDFVDLSRIFKDRGITAHFQSFRGASLEMGTPMGDFFLGNLVLIAQLEAATVSARNREVNEFKRLAGKVSTAECYGWQIIGKKTDREDTRTMIECPEEQAAMKAVYELRQSGLTFIEVANEMERRRCKEENIPCILSAFKRGWKLSQVHKLYWRYQALQLWKAFGGFDPVRYKIADGLLKVERILCQRGEMEAIAEIKRLTEHYVSKSSVLLRNRYQPRNQEN